MTASDRTDAGTGGRRPEAGVSLRPDEPMTDELCVFALSLVADGRPVPAELVRRAEAWADAHPACRGVLADFAAMGEALRDLPVPRARPGFAERVLAARESSASGARVLVLARRMAVAAALLLAFTVVLETTHPREAVADPDVTVERHAVDAFRARPFAGDDLDAGLAELLPDPARRSSGAAGSADARPGDDPSRLDGASDGGDTTSDDVVDELPKTPGEDGR
ncbi:MAG: hypothetical protein H6825_08810 [Planctomycetes bacterium]|nr:hypothetical protein [Planctomycetota bacterium]